MAERERRGWTRFQRWRERGAALAGCCSWQVGWSGSEWEEEGACYAAGLHGRGGGEERARLGQKPEQAENEEEKENEKKSLF